MDNIGHFPWLCTKIQAGHNTNSEGNEIRTEAVGYGN